MARLTVINNGVSTNIEYSGNPILRDLLLQKGIVVHSPCGGSGKCGKCRVRLFGDVSAPNQKENELGYRLACQAILLGDCTAEIINADEVFINIETKTLEINPNSENINWDYGIVADIGTTTVVLKLFSKKGQLLGEATSTNPQRSVSADIIGRIHSAVNGQGMFLKKQIEDCIFDLLSKVCKNASITLEDVTRKIITGNTAMLYLLMGHSPASIATAPFKADNLFGLWFHDIYLPRCMNAFVGADITCGILATGGCEKDDIFLFCDIGTNGEIALWKNNKLFITSAAAGPAFEGASISCGCGCINGAIDKVWIEDNKIKVHTIGEQKAVGICGSGLIDAVAVFLKLGYIESNGTVLKPLILSFSGGNIELTPEDICAVQLAKAAIAAAMEMVLSESKTEINDISKFYISGGFGSNISLENCEFIGLIPKGISEKAEIMGNSALSGGIMMLFDDKQIEKSNQIANNTVHIQLGGNEDFNSSYIKNMMFDI